MLLVGVNDEDDAREVAHVLDTTKVCLKLLPLAEHLECFLLGQGVRRSVGEHPVDVLQAIDRLLDGAEVGQRAAQPTVGDVIHAAAERPSANDFLGLLLCSDEENGLSAGYSSGHEVEGIVEEFFWRSTMWIPFRAP